MKYLGRRHLTGVACIVALGWAAAQASEPVLLSNLNTLTTISPNLAATGLSSLVQAQAAAPSGGLVPVSNSLWDETTVRKVLFTFAFGGQASDAQIKLWADMTPQAAIKEILSFSPHNLKLSKPAVNDAPNMALKDGTLIGLGKFWSSFAADNTVPLAYRARFTASEARAYGESIWAQANLTRGLNPFRQKIAWWESNYHLAFALGSVNTVQAITYYDQLSNALASGMPYQDVIATAATSSAIITQYKLHTNRFVNGVCRCNEDFAREFYQLFFGILGDQNRQEYEEVTIKETAKAFAGFEVPYLYEWGRLANYVVVNPSYQFRELLTVFGLFVSDEGNARIRTIANSAINHEESLDNLPVKIVQGLADDRLTPAAIEEIRATWRAMVTKNLLTFLQAYAISTRFHSPDRMKYWNSIERHFNGLSPLILDNQETYRNIYSNEKYMLETPAIFRPPHTIFGGQSGEEAAASLDVFRKNYNRATANAWLYSHAGDGTGWRKDWRSVISAVDTGNYEVWRVAEYLWQRFVGDGRKNFRIVERAHLYALLARGKDFSVLADPVNPNKSYGAREIAQSGSLLTLMGTLSEERLKLSDANADERLEANRRIGLAINFISATPYVFAQEGR